jgi:hypothetical protein
MPPLSGGGDAIPKRSDRVIDLGLGSASLASAWASLTARNVASFTVAGVASWQVRIRGLE